MVCFRRATRAARARRRRGSTGDRRWPRRSGRCAPGHREPVRDTERVAHVLHRREARDDDRQLHASPPCLRYGPARAHARSMSRISCHRSLSVRWRITARAREAQREAPAQAAHQPGVFLLDHVFDVVYRLDAALGPGEKAHARARPHLEPDLGADGAAAAPPACSAWPTSPSGSRGARDARRAQQPQHLAEALDGGNGERRPQVGPILDGAVVRPRAQRIEARATGRHSPRGSGAPPRRSARRDGAGGSFPAAYRACGVRSPLRSVYCARSSLAPRPLRRVPCSDDLATSPSRACSSPPSRGYFVAGHYSTRCRSGSTRAPSCSASRCRRSSSASRRTSTTPRRAAVLLRARRCSRSRRSLLRDARVGAREGRGGRRGPARVPHRRGLGSRHRARLVRGGGGGRRGARLPRRRARARRLARRSARASLDEGIVNTNPEWKQDWKGARVKGYRRLGRTGWKVSDIVLGTGRIRARTASRSRASRSSAASTTSTPRPTTRAGSEQAMGRAIRGVRDQLFIATKFCTPTGHLPPGTPVAKYMEAVEASLGRLGTDYVDLVSRALVRRGRAADGPERARGLRPAEAAGQGALPRLLDAHAEPGRGGEHRRSSRAAST